MISLSTLHDERGCLGSISWFDRGPWRLVSESRAVRLSWDEKAVRQDVKRGVEEEGAYSSDYVRSFEMFHLSLSYHLIYAYIDSNHKCYWLGYWVIFQNRNFEQAK